MNPRFHALCFLLSTACGVNGHDTGTVLDNGDTEVAPVDASAGDLNWNGHELGDTLPHALPDGTLGLWSDTGSALVWYDLADALTETWTISLSVPTGGNNQVVAEDIFELPDLEGDGQLDFVVGRLSGTDGASGVARFAGAPSALSQATAALYVESVHAIGLGADPNGDGIAELVVAWHEETTAAPSVAWVSPAESGTHAVGDVALTSLLVDPDVAAGMELACRASRAEPFDAEGDGIDETLVVVSGESDTYDSRWVQQGAGWLVPGVPGEAALAEAASASIRYGGTTHRVSDLASASDLDGDGYDDIVVSFESLGAEAEVHFLLGPFAGEVTEAEAVSTVSGFSRAFGFSAGDMDADGDTEVLFSGSIGTSSGAGYWDVFVYTDPLLGGTATAAEVHIASTADATALQDASLYDIDGDGLDDIVGTMIFLSP